MSFAWKNLRHSVTEDTYLSFFSAHGKIEFENFECSEFIGFEIDYQPNHGTTTARNFSDNSILCPKKIKLIGESNLRLTS